MSYVDLVPFVTSGRAIGEKATSVFWFPLRVDGEGNKRFVVIRAFTPGNPVLVHVSGTHYRWVVESGPLDEEGGLCKKRAVIHGSHIGFRDAAEMVKVLLAVDAGGGKL